ncbi:hypothetical protein DFH09DRAFT_1364717, partial [Mycena vulgaris]
MDCTCGLDLVALRLCGRGAPSDRRVCPHFLHDGNSPFWLGFQGAHVDGYGYLPHGTFTPWHGLARATKPIASYFTHRFILH